MHSESIKTLGRLAYIKLFNDRGEIFSSNRVYVDIGDFRKLLWRIYWRVDL